MVGVDGCILFEYVSGHPLFVIASDARVPLSSMSSSEFSSCGVSTVVKISSYTRESCPGVHVHAMLRPSPFNSGVA